MRGASQVEPRPLSGAKALRRCRNNGESENIVLIDVDSYNLGDVIVIDVPENITTKLRGSNGLKNDTNWPPRTYIYIDDDEESSDNFHAGEGVDGVGNFDNGASSSRRYASDAQFAQENVSPVKLSKGKRTYSGRGFNNRNGFSSQSDGDDGHDCEFMEDSSGELREQWERAYSKRKAEANSDQCGRSDHSSSSRDTRNDTPVSKHKQKLEEVLKTPNSKGTGYKNKGQSPIGTPSDLKEPSCDDCNLDTAEKPHTCHINAHSQEENEANGLLSASSVDDVPVEDSIINQREKLKETDEYKRALEEECLARQRALKIQAEEAQHLRRLQKRRKAETLRILDMEKRQKQRVEEIRETQKKDEENMNLKELYRSEVRQELNKLEMRCHDMASLLRGLGIHVGDGFCPLKHEVRAAYKRALLSFHPDRASCSDLRQQVEAEEKFKLISRMKDKLL